MFESNLISAFTHCDKSWVKSTIGEVIRFIDYRGRTPTKTESGLRLITAKNVKMGYLQTNPIEFVAPKSYDAWMTRGVPRRGNVLFTTEAPLANVAQLDTDEKVVFAQRIIIMQPDASKLDSTFLKYLMISQSVQQRIHEKGTGATVRGIKARLLKTIEISFPKSLPEQQRIVGILDEAFDGIATAKANAEKNLQNARALFESHLNSVFTQRGPGWKEKTLQEIATTFGRGKSKHRPRNEPKLYGGKYPFIQTGDIRNADHLITEYSQTYSEAGLAQSKLWPRGTICITIAANIAETGILNFDACFPDSVIGVVTNPKEADVGYVEYLLQSFKARLQAMGKGSAQANINMGTFENERFPFPSVPEQERIVAKLDALAEETQRLESIYQQKLAALEELKKSLLDQAFSGAL
jgi:type I restriction enzyme S subunit